MKKASQITEKDLYHKLKLLMLFRIIFTSILLGSTIIIQLNEDASPLAKPLLLLYGLILGIFILSFIYTRLITRMKSQVAFAYLQIGVDTFVVTLIILAHAQRVGTAVTARVEANRAEQPDSLPAPPPAGDREWCFATVLLRRVGRGAANRD